MKNETIVCISPEVWTGMWRERQQIMSRLARDNRVIFVEPGRDDHKSYLNSLLDNLSQLPALEAESVTDNLIVYPGPPSLPYAATRLPSRLMRVAGPAVTAVNSTIMERHVRRILSKEGAVDPILWFFGPSCIELVGRLGEKMICYYVYDEIAEFERNARYKEFLQERDRTLTLAADVVFASSRSQYERRRLLNPATYFTPHGVDFEHYSKTLDPDTRIPDDIAAVRKPIVGYIGCLSGNLDATILLEMSETRPDWSIVLVGPDEFPGEDAYERLKSRPNIHILGRRDVGVIPNYLKAFDVAMMPYRIIAHTKYAYPCKLHEYLASGRPVVATPLPELLAFGDVIQLARSPAEFMLKIREILRGNGPGNVETRLAVASRNTWDQRVSVIREAIDYSMSIRCRGSVTRETARSMAG